MNNVPKIKIGIVAVSRDCFPESLAVNRRKAVIAKYVEKFDAADIYECPICIVRHRSVTLEKISPEPKRVPSLVILWMTRRLPSGPSLWGREKG